MVFSPGRVDVCRMGGGAGERRRIAEWESFAVEDGELAALKRLRASRGLDGAPCTTLLGQGQYQVLQVEAPSVAREEWRDAVRWRIKEMVEFPVEGAGIGVLEIPTPGRQAQVHVVAASRAVLEQRVRLFQDARVPLQVIDIPELAQRNIASLFEEENRGIAMLAFDSQGGRLIFTYRGELYSTRHIETTQDELAAAGEAAAPLHERVLLDVQRSLDNFDRNFSFISLTRLLVAPIPGAPQFVEYLKSNLYQPVEEMDLAQALDLSDVPALADPQAQSAALLAVGAALRQEAVA